MKGERFLPFRRTDVVSMCAAEVPDGERDEFLAFGRTLAGLLHHRFHERIEALKDAYYPFQPQADTRVITTLDAAARAAARARLETELTALAEAANFTPMTLKEVEEAMAGQLRPFLERATAFLEREVRARRLRAHDPLELMQICYGAVFTYFSDARFRERLLGEDPLSPDALDRHRDALNGLLRAALAPR